MTMNTVEALICGVCLSAFLFCLVLAEVERVQRKDRPKAKPKAEPEPAPDGTCWLPSTRAFEWVLVEAGVIDQADMTLCENDRCVSCHPVKTKSVVVKQAGIKNVRPPSRHSLTLNFCGDCNEYFDPSTSRYTAQCDDCAKEEWNTLQGAGGVRLILDGHHFTPVKFHQVP